MSGPERRPNFLLVVADQHRFDLGPGYPGMDVVMPHLARLAAQGLRFSHAITPSPLCAPARSCLATATAYGRSGVWNNQGVLTDSHETYYGHLRDGGYAVLGAGKFDLHKGGDCWGTEGQCGLDAWGITAGIDCEGKHDAVRTGADVPQGPYMRHLHDNGLAQQYVDGVRACDPYDEDHPSTLPASAYLDNWIADQAERLLTNTPTDRPWHLVANFAGPHEPLDPTTEMLEAISDLDTDAMSPARLPAASAKLLRPYLAMLRNLDVRLGRLLDLVQQRGELDRTVVIYASDHGEMLGELGIRGKGTFHEASVRIPLAIYDPRRLPPCDVYCGPVALQDIGPTILEWASCRSMPPDDAVSLCALFEGGESVRSFATSGLMVDALEAENLAKVYFPGEIGRARALLTGDWRLVSDGRFKLVSWDDGRIRLFDTAADPQESTNLLDLPELPDEARTAFAALSARLLEVFGPRPRNEEA